MSDNEELGDAATAANEGPLVRIGPVSDWCSVIESALETGIMPLLLVLVTAAGSSSDDLSTIDAWAHLVTPESILDIPMDGYLSDEVSGFKLIVAPGYSIDEAMKCVPGAGRNDIAVVVISPHLPRRWKEWNMNSLDAIWGMGTTSELTPFAEGYTGWRRLNCWKLSSERRLQSLNAVVAPSPGPPRVGGPVTDRDVVIFILITRDHRRDGAATIAARDAATAAVLHTPPIFPGLSDTDHVRIITDSTMEGAMSSIDDADDVGCIIISASASSRGRKNAIQYVSSVWPGARRQHAELPPSLDKQYAKCLDGSIAFATPYLLSKV